MVKRNKTPSLNTVREYCIINHLILAFSLFHYLENHIVTKAKCTWTTLPKSLHIGVTSLTVASPPLFTSSIWQKYKPRLLYLFMHFISRPSARCCGCFRHFLQITQELCMHSARKKHHFYLCSHNLPIGETYKKLKNL